MLVGWVGGGIAGINLPISPLAPPYVCALLGLLGGWVIGMICGAVMAALHFKGQADTDFVDPDADPPRVPPPER